MILALVRLIFASSVLAASSGSHHEPARSAEHQQAYDAAPEPAPFNLKRGGVCGDESVAGLSSELGLSAQDLEKRSGVPGLELVAVLTGAAKAGHGGITGRLNWLQPELERDAAFFRGYAPTMAVAHERIQAALFSLRAQFGEMSAVAEPAAACFVKLMARSSPATQRSELTRCFALADKFLHSYPKFQEAVWRLANGQIEVLTGQEEYLRRLASNPSISPSERNAARAAFGRVQNQKQYFIAIREEARKQPWDSLSSGQQKTAWVMAGVIKNWREVFFALLRQPRFVSIISAREYGALDLGCKVVAKQAAIAEREWGQLHRSRTDETEGHFLGSDVRGVGAVRGSYSVFFSLWELQGLLELLRPGAEQDSLCARRNKASSEIKID